jgi:hypothetical protein
MGLAFTKNIHHLLFVGNVRSAGNFSGQYCSKRQHVFVIGMMKGAYLFFHLNSDNVSDIYYRAYFGYMHLLL